ncbi:MAG TPA: formylmethanofuran dehydrogenase subunit B [Archaeoglobus profundus]|nr:formylmethanofuran dehydrogenase subunit B [Archaeoglobus profundus]
MQLKVEDVVCPFCGCLCDDLIVEVEGNEIKSVENACKLGAHRFLDVKKNRIKKPLIKENGKFKEVSYEEAIDKAVEILTNAKKPLLYGFSSTSCEVHEVAIELAEILGAVIDNTASVCHGPSILAIQEVGYPSVTLGEVKNRADLVIYWGCNPMHAHPRHMSRYSIFPRGMFRDKGKIDREVIVVDVRKTETAELADWFIKVKPGYDYEVLNALRTILNKGDINRTEVGGISKEVLKKLVEKMKGCKFGIIFFGVGLTMSGAKHRNIFEAIKLVRDLNNYTKFSIMAMRGHYNVAGFNEVLTWETGYPFAVDFTRGYPWFNPGETDANSLLQARDVDAALIIASDPAAHFPMESVKYLAKIPVIVIDPFESLTTKIADVVIPSKVVGVEEEGSAYRMDGVPLRLKKVIDAEEYLSDLEIMERILEKVKEKILKS